MNTLLFSYYYIHIPSNLLLCSAHWHICMCEFVCVCMFLYVCVCVRACASMRVQRDYLFTFYGIVFTGNVDQFCINLFQSKYIFKLKWCNFDYLSNFHKICRQKLYIYVYIYMSVCVCVCVCVCERERERERERVFSSLSVRRYYH